MTMLNPAKRKRSYAELDADNAVLTAQNSKLTKLLGNTIPFIFRAVPALAPIIGKTEMPAMPTNDHQAVIFDFPEFSITVNPTTEKILLDGRDTGVKHEFHAPDGKLSSVDQHVLNSMMRLIERAVDPDTENVTIDNKAIALTSVTSPAAA